MFASFRYLDGPRTDLAQVAARDFLTIGRHPESDVPFDDPSQGDVSVRHAAVFRQGGGFMVRDLGSTNGTYLNGTRVRGDRPLEPGDVLQLGTTGPRLEFTTVATLPVMPRSGAVPAGGPPPASTEIYRPRQRSTSRQPAVDPPKPTRRGTRWLGVVGVIAVGLAASLLIWRAREARAAIEERRAAVLRRVDDHLNRLGQARSSLGGVLAAIEAAKAATARLRAAVVGLAPSGQAGFDSLIARVDSAAAAQEPLLRAAAFDPSTVTAVRQSATAVIIAEFAGGATKSGSALAVKSLGDTAWLATARVVVVDSAGLPAVRIATILAGARQAYLGELVRDSGTVATIKVVVRSRSVDAAPVRPGGNAGDVVVAIGFLHGADSLGDWRRLGASPQWFLGVVAPAGGPPLAVDGFGVDAPLGSAVLGADGGAVGVVQGSRAGRWSVSPLRPIPD